jgi:GxxExxY protein
MLRIDSPLTDDVERLMRGTIGCCIAVHRELGPGLLEHIYARALMIEFRIIGIPFEREKRYPVRYRDELIGEQYLDFVIGDQIVMEIKSVERFAAVHHQQILNYMRIARVRAGLLVNFNVKILPDGLSRKVL